MPFTRTEGLAGGESGKDAILQPQQSCPNFTSSLRLPPWSSQHWGGSAGPLRVGITRLSHSYIIFSQGVTRASLAAQMVKKLPEMQETQVRLLAWGDPLEKGVATHSGILARRVPWTEEPGGLQSLSSKESDMTGRQTLKEWPGGNCHYWNSDQSFRKHTPADRYSRAGAWVVVVAFSVDCSEASAHLGFCGFSDILSEAFWTETTWLSSNSLVSVGLRLVHCFAYFW